MTAREKARIIKKIQTLLYHAEAQILLRLYHEKLVHNSSSVEALSKFQVCFGSLFWLIRLCYYVAFACALVLEHFIQIVPDTIIIHVGLISWRNKFKWTPTKSSLMWIARACKFLFIYNARRYSGVFISGMSLDLHKPSFELILENLTLPFDFWKVFFFFFFVIFFLN